MKKPFPPGFPQFETEEQLQALIREALDDPDPGIEMTEEEWRKLYAECGVPYEERGRLAS